MSDTLKGAKFKIKVTMEYELECQCPEEHLQAFSAYMLHIYGSNAVSRFSDEIQKMNFRKNLNDSFTTETQPRVVSINGGVMKYNIIL